MTLYRISIEYTLISNITRTSKKIELKNPTDHRSVGFQINSFVIRMALAGIEPINDNIKYRIFNLEIFQTPELPIQENTLF